MDTTLLDLKDCEQMTVLNLLDFVDQVKALGIYSDVHLSRGRIVGGLA